MSETGQTETADPIIAPASVPTGAAIVQTPTTIAPLVAADGTPAFIVQVAVGTQNYSFPNAASWTHNADNSLDIYDDNGNLIGSYMQGVATSVQLVPAPPPPVTPSA
jgi:hypothetical protein